MKEWELFIEFLQRKNLSPASIEQYCRLIKYFNWPMNQQSVNEFLNKRNQRIPRAFIKNWIECFDIPNIKIPKITGRRPSKIPKVLTKGEVYEVMRAMPNIMYKLMTLISFQGGLRLQELLGIKPFDFRWNKWNEDQSKPGELKIMKGKGNKQRIVFLSPSLMAATYNYIMKYRSHVSKEEPIFPISKVAWTTHTWSASKKALGFYISPHVFRHSCATYLLSILKWDVMEVKEYLGHESIATTQIYLHVDKEGLKDKFSI